MSSVWLEFVKCTQFKKSVFAFSVKTSFHFLVLMLLSSKLTFKINLLTDNYLEIPHLLIQYKGEMFDMNFRSLQLSPQH